MASHDINSRSKPLAIAPAPPRGSGAGDDGSDGATSKPSMSFSCQACARRKVKCDKATPTCSRCRKSVVECVYETPRPRKRKLSSDVLERLARYERILRQHGLLESDGIGTESAEEPVSLLWDEPEDLRTGGRLLANRGKSRYLGSKLWRNLECDHFQGASDVESEDDEMPDKAIPAAPSDPLTEAFMSGPQRSLLLFHPTPENAWMLWTTHIERVEPLCKILHIPSTTRVFEAASQEPSMVSKPNECLLFSVYHFAVLSMTEEECISKLGRPRAVLLHQYNFAARQALVNAGFLKTTELAVLQALVLYLLSSQYSYGAHTYWILTGVAVRIAQRIGLHRDGEKLGLPPFDVEMRRRLFYQLMPLDARASGAAGMGISMLPEAWDTRSPLNINDDQIWPGMAEQPQERKGATEMLFCLSRVCLGNFFASRAKPTEGRGPNSWLLGDVREAEKLVTEAESEVEEKYIRYCDVVNALHFLTVCLARSGITAMRLRVRLPKARSYTASDADKREVFQLAQNILETDVAVCSHPGVQKYQWHLRHFFLWGTWDSFIFILTTLLRSKDMLSAAEIDTVWAKVEQMHHHHDELLGSKRALYVALGRLTLKAWEAHPPTKAGDGSLEPAFISSLRSLCTKSEKDNNKASLKGSTETSLDPVTNHSFDDIAPDIDGSFNLNEVDWAFWDQLIQDNQAQNGQQQNEFSLFRP
ncbi:Transcription factor vrtR1 [Madurella fahalii]|uniref:Transcription factor vrtR1 n=1 Tax=Madurella fahalii TaxID=1157608 RepID=A0ABQ0GND3_9PEZI